ncbi:MAG: M28 family peptidase [Planctomycetota bacterium]|nr:M28 family peptidase [Planctomycetota bacterium]MCX8038969.1 M28 family peptidase [Planctomycetota bacterium]MDW8372780.1 M28 family peptidase [Planctomycetota bacterium]
MTGAAVDPARCALAERLLADVEQLALRIGPRHAGCPAGLEAAARWLEQRGAELGVPLRREPAPAGDNLVAELAGAGPRLLIGAHYDSVPDVPEAPGADDNASGVAVLLELLGRAVRQPLPCALRAVCFANEEAMRWRRADGGSWRHAQRLAAGELAAALIIDAVGYYDARRGSQHWPAWWMPLWYGTRGDFLCVQAAWRDRRLAWTCLRAARGHGLPVRGCWWPFQRWQLMGDQESFVAHGIPTIALTDTDRFRNPHFHRLGDRPETLDAGRLAAVAEAAWAALQAMARWAQARGCARR